MQSVKYNEVVVLEIISWGAVGGNHFYGSIKPQGENSLSRIKFEVEYRLTEEQAASFRRDESCPDIYTYKAGEISTRFLDDTLLIKRAQRTWKREFPNAKVLLEGSTSVVDPQRCLAADDKELKKALNALYRAAEKIDFWEEDEEKMQKIHDNWISLIVL